MKLEELKINGYRCFKESTSIPFKNLTVLIGENDCGKSSILRAIELLLTKASCSDEDFFELGGIQLDEFSVSGVFKLTNTDNKEALKPYVINNEISYKKVFKKHLSFQTTINKM